MNITNIEDPKTYLSYFKNHIEQSKKINKFPKVKSYYQELEAQFLAACNDRESKLFSVWRKLLSIDAQLQILLDVIHLGILDLVKRGEMTEEAIINMVKGDQKSYYRELCGYTTNHPPRWALIYLSEK
ncbi:hypothetical protein FG877_09995 [Enterococcus casseliflavus]|nr:hypothetical protein [Enterococcus casseliflavus]